jgi:hypothetical protein
LAQTSKSFLFLGSSEVLTAQTNFLIRNDGKKPFVISPGLQLAGNAVGSSAGPWSGQGFVRFGAAEITQGPIDWFNPFVTLALEWVPAVCSIGW